MKGRWHNNFFKIMWQSMEACSSVFWFDWFLIDFAATTDGKVRNKSSYLYHSISTEWLQQINGCVSYDYNTSVYCHPASGKVGWHFTITTHHVYTVTITTT